MSGNVTHLSDATFEEEVLKSEVPVLVDFWAEWCGPCRMVSPIIEELAAEYGPRLKVAKANTDECTESAAQHQITAIPTVILFQNGEETLRLVGVRSKEEYRQEIDQKL